MLAVVLSEVLELLVVAFESSKLYDRVGEEWGDGSGVDCIWSAGEYDGDGVYTCDTESLCDKSLLHDWLANWVVAIWFGLIIFWYICL